MTEVKPWGQCTECGLPVWSDVGFRDHLLDAHGVEAHGYRRLREYVTEYRPPDMPVVLF